ncbi:unnamed protein product [Debaryomyces tyrocola]|nr:unnamed protein product [Debaryomyces tyrocola]
MKLISILAIIACLGAVIGAIEKVKIYIESEDDRFDHAQLQSRHEGAGIDYEFFLDSKGTALAGNYDDQKKRLWFYGEEFDKNFTLLGNVVSLSILKADPVTFEDGYLKLNDTEDGFFACKNITDPYHYSKKQHALVFYPNQKPNGDDCAALKFKKE